MAPRVLVPRWALPVLLATVMAAGTSLAVTPAGAIRRVVETVPSSLAAAGSSSFGADDAHRRPVWPVAVVATPPKPAPPRTAPRPQPKPATAASTPSLSKPVSRPSPPAYKGRNHLWIPALGVNRSVGWYPCGASSAPGLGVYRWGCAGRNNVYLLAHAYAAFRSLHDAYVSGRLRKGMRVMYADGSGRVRTYSVIWWRLTSPTNGAFAYAAQSRPSMTLQTCVGARSQYRLIVRLVAIS
jgi:sortase (surface protein transpeptidase)